MAVLPCLALIIFDIIRAVFPQIFPEAALLFSEAERSAWKEELSPDGNLRGQESAAFLNS